MPLERLPNLGAFLTILRHQQQVAEAAVGREDAALAVGLDSAFFGIVLQQARFEGAGGRRSDQAEFIQPVEKGLRSLLSDTKMKAFSLALSWQVALWISGGSRTGEAAGSARSG